MIVPAATSALTGPMDRSSVFSHPKRSDLGAPASSDQVAMTAPGSDETLLAGLASGDDHLEVAFVRRFQGRVYGLARRSSGKHPWLRTWRKKPSFGPGVTPGASTRTGAQ